MIRSHLTQKLVSRRRTLSALVRAGGAALFIPAWNEAVEAADAITCVLPTPTVTEGPYWVDEKLFRSDIRTDPATGVAREGVPLSLTINVQNLDAGSCVPLVGAYVDIWHCDAKGIYSDESTYNPGGGTGSVNTSGQKFLRGYQITDENGQVKFTTIYPGWYTGRTIHIHMRVRTYSGSTVIGNFVSQVFFDETSNNTVLASSSYSRSTPRDTTNASDNIYRVANQERMLATTSGNVSSGYQSEITVGVSLQAPAVQLPTITSGSIANAFSGASGIASGAWISIYGSNFTTTTRTLTSADLVENAIPSSLAGVSVQINGKAAYVHFISPTQINVLAPGDASQGAVPVTVTNSAGTSNAVTATIFAVLPGLAVASNYIRAVRHPDGAIINGTGAAETGYVTSAAAAPGDTLAIYGTGFGPTSPAVQSGLVFSAAYPTTNDVTVTIGGISAPVAWAGLVGPGLYQINITVPAALADGEHAVIATVSGSSSQSSAKLKVSRTTAVAQRQLPSRRFFTLAGSPQALPSSWLDLVNQFRA